MAWKPLPIGVDNFKEIISNGYYYVDKTWFIRELWEKRQGKSLYQTQTFW